MEFDARLLEELPMLSGTSARTGNPWKKRQWVVETFGQYPKKVMIQCFGDRSDSWNLEAGRDYTFSVDLESREFNGKWYSDINVYAVREMASPAAAGGYPGQPAQSFGQPAQQPFGQPVAQPFAQPAQQPFGQPAYPQAPAPAPGDPFGVAPTAPAAPAADENDDLPF